MTSTLARQTAIVLVEALPKSDDQDVWAEFLDHTPKRIPTVAIFPCFHANQGLKVVTAPNDDVIIHPYSVVHPSGFTVPNSETHLLQRAIAFCDLCAQNIPELTQAGLIFNQLPIPTRHKIKKALLEIIALLDHEIPEYDED